MRARYYDYDTGRFISEDPNGFGGGDVNLYAYCGNNPVNFVDPLGLEAIPGVGVNTRSESLEQWGIYLHGTNAGGAAGIISSGHLDPDSWVTKPYAIDSMTLKPAIMLNPPEYRAFTGTPGSNKGEYFVLVIAPSESVQSRDFTTGGAPQWQINGKHEILRVYRNTNR